MIVWSPGMSIEDMENNAIKEAISYYKDNEKAADSLKITLDELNKKIAKYAKEHEKNEEKRMKELQTEREFDRRARGIIESIPEENILSEKTQQKSYKKNQKTI